MSVREAVLKFFDWIRGKKHPTALWRSDPGLEIHLNLDRHALCRCTIGDSIEWLSGLGRPEDTAALREGRYLYYSHGIEIGQENGKVADFAVFWIDYLEAGFRTFTGLITYRGKAVSLSSRTSEGEFVNLFGSPYWRDQDQDEIILFYEFQGDIEWQVEFTLEGDLKAIRVVWPSLMSEEKQRELYGVSLPWPPQRRR